MPLPRFRLRTLMIAVAVVGIALGVESIRRRWVFSRASFTYHANEERRMALLLRGGFIHKTDETGKRRRMQVGRNLEREQVQRRFLYHSVMKGRYQRAAHYPWLPVPPDPPMPE